MCMTGMQGWFKCSIKRGVMSQDGLPTDEFLKWRDTCSGQVKIKINPSRFNLVMLDIYFENQEDCVLYQLTFDELDPVPLTWKQFYQINTTY